MAALARASASVGTKTGVHICYGYGGSEVTDWKAANRDWSHYEQSLALVARTNIDEVSIETAAVGVDIDVIELLRGKDVLLGLSATSGSRRPRRSPADCAERSTMSSRTGCSPAPIAAWSCAAAKRPRQRCRRWRRGPRSSTRS